MIDLIMENIKNTGNVWGTTIEYVYKRKFDFWKWTITVEQRRASNMWGRFGGGWNWKLGVQIGGSTWIWSFLVMQIVISRKD